MKKILTISLLTILLGLTSCGSSISSTPETNTVVSNQEKTPEFNQAELALGSTLRNCFLDWSSHVNKFKNIEIDNEKAIKEMSIGLIAKQCLQIEEVSKLKIVLEAYEKNLEDIEINWNQLGKKITKMESL